MDRKIFEKRLEVIQENRRKMMEEYGWVADLVPAEDGQHANYHTHGVQEHFNHPDFQITLNIDPKLAHSLLAEAVGNVKKGKVFHDGEKSPLIIQKLHVLLKAFEEGERTVLRIMLPDPSGLLPTEEGCEDMYRTQLDDTVE